jgi:4-amino-4-deoxy-L-arabinose transferase-like glycosyltransferase
MIVHILKGSVRKQWWLLLIAIPLAWSVCAAAYIFHTPENRRTQLDTDGHIEYTQFLHQTGSLPVGGQLFEGHQPPLYYAINQLLYPESVNHERNVRLLGVLYGALTLVLLIIFLQLLDTSVPVAAITSLIAATTPSFLYLFTSYTNDTLATLLAGASLTAAYALIRKKVAEKTVLGLAACLALLLYTKLTGTFLIGGLLVASLALFQQNLVSLKQLRGLCIAMVLAVFSLTPWLYNNFVTIGSPTYSEFAAGVDVLQHITKSPVAFVLTPPGVTSHEWQTPYVWSGTFPHFWAKQNFLSTLYSSSMFGSFSLMPIVGIAWYIFWFHTLLLARIAKRFKPTREILFSIGSILGATLAQALFVWRWPYTCHADFRLQLWSIIPLTYVFAVTLTKHNGLENWKLSRYALALAGVLLAAQMTHLAFLLTKTL